MLTHPFDCHVLPVISASTIDKMSLDVEINHMSTWFVYILYICIMSYYNKNICSFTSNIVCVLHTSAVADVDALNRFNGHFSGLPGLASHFKRSTRHGNICKLLK